MTANEAVMLDGSVARVGDPGKIVIATRFGEMEFDPSQAIHLPRGVLGFPGKQTFALAQLPQPGMSHFSLLQCLDDPELSFLVLPFDIESGAIDRADLERARDELGIAADDLAVVLIVAIREVADRPEISVNLRAPILLDAQKRTGAQSVLTNSKYPVRHLISPQPPSAPSSDIG